MASRLLEIQRFGQSIWHDNLRRGLLLSGELERMVEEGLLGITSNPAIFQKAMSDRSEYDPALTALIRQEPGPAGTIFERIAIEDIQLAADVLRPAWERTEGRDGYVSMEVSPYLARDTEATLEEARRLFASIGRENVMIKVPATPEGIPAIRRLISEGIHVNVTLLFSVDVYEEVARAYRKGLAELLAAGGDPRRVASVASFFLSRIDTMVDQRLAALLSSAGDAGRRKRVESLMGKAAVANAKTAYARYRILQSEEEWKRLAEKGARPQRLLWASTSTKNPSYPKLLYVEDLIGPDTVNTLPEETLVTFRDQARLRASLVEDGEEGLGKAAATLQSLAELGISMDEVTGRLLEEGIRKFSEPFDQLLAAIERRRREVLGPRLASLARRIGDAGASADAALDEWRQRGNVRRLWRGDASLWTGADEGRWLGWLNAVDETRRGLEPIQRLARELRGDGLRHAVLLGMGGSSLAPEVFARTLGPVAGFPELIVLDSTVPAQIRQVERLIDVASTLFIVSSKSGTTVETRSLEKYFYDRLASAVGKERAGSQFVAITDPGTPLQKLARTELYRHVALGDPAIGGRYSALSPFGVLPAAILGVEVPELLERAARMVHSCHGSVPPEVNPGVELGVTLGTLARQGRDKLTIVTSPRLRSLGAWLEQLVAESTGKEGKGIIPVDEEDLGAPGVYGGDRVFVYTRLGAAPDEAQDRAVAALEEAGAPVIRIDVAEEMDLGQELFRWEIATAVAGAVLRLHPFDQPDVEASKAATRKLTAAFEDTGALPEERAFLEDGDIQLFADPSNAEELRSRTGAAAAGAVLAAHLARLAPGDYFAIQAYLEKTDPIHEQLQAIRIAVRDAQRVATTLGYGPRFLHSTGQLHKGGPNTGVFLQITARAEDDLAIPGERFGFAQLQSFQARGDFEVLAARGRRALRVHLGADVAADLTILRQWIG